MNRVNARSLSLILASALLAAAGAPAALAAPGAPATHAHDDAHPAKLRLDQGRKWGTDKPLRDGMVRVRALVAPQVAAVHGGTMGAAGYAALAGKVEVEMGNIVATCKLPPDADAMLHIVLADLSAGTTAMAGRTPGATRQQGFLQVLAAINAYERTFDHPGFQPIRGGH